MISVRHKAMSLLTVMQKSYVWLIISHNSQTWTILTIVQGTIKYKQMGSSSVHLPLALRRRLCFPPLSMHWHVGPSMGTSVLSSLFEGRDVQEWGREAYRWYRQAAFGYQRWHVATWYVLDSLGFLEPLVFRYLLMPPMSMLKIKWGFWADYHNIRPLEEETA